MKKAVGMFIENYNGDILLHLRDEHAPVLACQWSVNGGSVDKGESLEDAVIRETKEETDLTIYDLKQVDDYIFRDDGKHVYIFHGKVDTRKEKMILGEGKELRWFSKPDLIKFLKNLSYSNQNLEALLRFLDKTKKQT